MKRKIYIFQAILSIVTLILSIIFLILGLVSTYSKVSTTFITNCEPSQSQSFVTIIYIVQWINVSLVSLGILLEIIVIVTCGCFSKQQKKHLILSILKLLTGILFSLFIVFGTLLGHSIKLIVHLLNIANCSSSIDITRTVINNNIVLSVMAGLSLLIVIIQIIIILVAFCTEDFNQEATDLYGPKVQEKYLEKSNQKLQNSKYSEIVLFVDGDKNNSHSELKKTEKHQQDNCQGHKQSLDEHLHDNQKMKLSPQKSNQKPNSPFKPHSDHSENKESKNGKKSKIFGRQRMFIEHKSPQNKKQDERQVNKQSESQKIPAANIQISHFEANPHRSKIFEPLNLHQSIDHRPSPSIFK